MPSMMQHFSHQTFALRSSSEAIDLQRPHYLRTSILVTELKAQSQKPQYPISPGIAALTVQVI
jgi:hypothetical protein